MKKKLLFSLLIILMLVATGCGKSKEPLKTFKCTTKGTIVEGTTITKTYNVEYRGEFVETEKQTETLKSDSSEILAAYQKTLEAMNEVYKGVKYYTYKVELNGDTLTNNITIDYTKVNTDKLIEVNPAHSDYIKDGKVTVSALKQKYEDEGITCE